ncbi:tethering complex subunit [Massospora cicadina]|nr:tethering complex subunit [Massospora cicadina]
MVGHQVMSIAWDNRSAAQTNTGTLLVGTSAGVIFEIYIEPSEDHFKREDRWVKALIDPRQTPVTGLYYATFPASPSKAYLLITTPTRLFEFIGKTLPRRARGADQYEPTFCGTFSFAESSLAFYELLSGLNYSEAHYFSKYFGRESGSVASSFAWLTGTGAGIYHGNLVFGSQKPGETLIDNGQLTPYPGGEIPSSMGITEFHFILLYPKRLKAVCRLNLETVYDEAIPAHLGRAQTAHQLTQDVTHNTFWVHTAQNIYELILTREDRDVWRFYLNQGQYAEALAYAKTPPQKHRVLKAQGDQFFETSRYNLAATFYGRSDAPLEETALKFIGKGEKDALRSFLLQRLEKLSRKDVMQTVLLGTWLVELYLSRINEMEDSAANAAKAEKGAGEKRRLPNNGADEVPEAGCESAGGSQHYVEESHLLIEEFRRFLDHNKAVLDHKTTYYLMNSHGRASELLYFAEITRDHTRVIGHHIQLHRFDLALAALSKQEDPELFYKFAPSLMEHAPEDLVSLLMRSTQLDAKRLIPALLKYKHGDGVHQAIRYLQFVVQKLRCTDPPVHNLLLSLYASQLDDSEAHLLQFLASEAHGRHYSLDYALRLCLQYNRVHAAVLIYGFLGLYEAAVEAALKHGDLELAKINADKADDNPELRRSLWLRVARHVVDQGDTRGAIALLQQCELLKVEDLLPLFPDFVLIDDFKEEICSALEDYHQQIEEIKLEMELATRSTDRLRQSIAGQKSRYRLAHAYVRLVMLAPGERCAVCDLPALTRQFYIFPCQHAFHADCLAKEVAAHAKPSEAQRLADLQRQLAQEIARYRSAANVADPSNLPTRPAKAKIEQLKGDLDALVAAECCLCGDLMIRSVEEPFIAESDFEAAISWLIYQEPATLT